MFCCSCDQDDGFVGETNLDISLKGSGNILFESQQCAYDDNIFSWAYNFTGTDTGGTPLNQTFISSHEKIGSIAGEEVDVIVWLSVKYAEDQNSHDIQLMKNEFSEQMDFTMNSRTPIFFRIDIGEKVFDNDFGRGWSINQSNDYFDIQLKSYKFDYDNNCDNSRLLFMEFEVAGTLYQQDRGNRIDSICLESSDASVIFDIE